VETVLSPRAVDFVRRRGGRLFVWADGPCCWGTRLIRASLAPPADARTFDRFDLGELQLYVQPVRGRLPDDLHVDVRGTRRPRAEAYWNGCAYAL